MWVFILLLLASCTIQYTPYDTGLPKTGEWRTTLAVADVNNDGLPDIAGIGRKGTAYASVWLNQGNGSWKPAVEGIPQTMQCGVGVDFGDVNNDGNIDVAFGQHCGGPAVYLGDGKGGWTNHSKGLSTENVNPIKLADLDNDGLLDIITLGAFLEGFEIYKNTGDWEQKNTSLPKEIRATTYQIITEDINNDEKTDILATGGKMHVFINKGNFEFEDKSPSTEEFYTFLAVDKELLAAGTTQGLQVYKNFEMYRNLTTCEKSGGLAFSDINNDGKTDLTASCTNGIKTYLGPYFEEIKNNIPQVQGIPYGLIVQDLNNDGKKDIAAAFNEGIYVYKRK